MGADGTDQQGMAIVRCTRNQPCSNASTGATPILDHDRYTVLVLKLLPEYACHQIGRTSRAKWHHYGERLPRPDLLAAGTRRRHACSGRSQQKVASPDHVPLHLTFDPPRDGQPPSFRSRFVPTLHAWSHPPALIESIGCRTAQSDGLTRQRVTAHEIAVGDRQQRCQAGRPPRDFTDA